MKAENAIIFGLPRWPTALLSHRCIKSVCGLVFLCLSAGLIYYLRLDDCIGQVRDDAWYVLLAKSLATGQGYELINSPVSGILPSYPPAFSFLLSLVLRLFPAAIQQLWLLKWVSIVAMLAMGVATYFYLSRFSKLPLHLAVAVAVAITTMPAFVFLATSTVMSECVFSLGQLLTMLVIEKAVRQAKQRKQVCSWVLAAMLAAFTFLTRSVAVTLIAAVVIYLLKERQRKAALLFAGCTLLLISPWLFYARWHAPTVEEKKMHGGYILYSYGEQFWMKRAGDTESGTDTFRDLPARVWKNIYNIVAHDFCGIVLPSALRDAAESGEEVLGLGEMSGTMLKSTSMGQVKATHVISLLLAILALIGLIRTVRQRITLVELVTFCSLALIVIWPWLTFRFLLPLAPFLLHYILQGLATLMQWMKRTDVWALPRVFMLCVLALYACDHWGYLKHKWETPESVSWLSEFNEVKATLHWVQTNLPPETIVATNNPAQLFLYTNRKAVTSGNPREHWENWNRLGVRYLVILSSYASTRLDDEQKTYPIIYGDSPEHMRVIDLGPPASRQRPE